MNAPKAKIHQQQNQILIDTFAVYSPITGQLIFKGITQQ